MPEPLKPVHFLDFQKAYRLIAAAEGVWRTMIITGLQTDMRIGELVGFQFDDIDFERAVLTVSMRLTSAAEAAWPG